MVKKLQTVSGAITVLVDNTIMELVPDSTFVKRLSKPSANFLAEHGFSDGGLGGDDGDVAVPTGAAECFAGADG